MVTCVVFDTENEDYNEIRGYVPIGRTHRAEQKKCLHVSCRIFQGKKLH